MKPNNLIFRMLTFSLLLLFTTVEAIPVIVSCTMGSSCAMTAKKKSCHTSINDLAFSSKSCCETTVANKKTSDKELVSFFSLVNCLLTDETFTSNLTHQKNTVYFSKPNVNSSSSPPLFLLNQSFLI